MCLTHIYLVSLDLFYCFVIYYYVKSGDSLLRCLFPTVMEVVLSYRIVNISFCFSICMV